MFGAAAVRNKKRREQQAINALNAQRGPYIKPFGPRFDPNVYPYVKYKKALKDESIHFGATNTSIASSGGRKDSKVSRIDDERRKKLEQLNEDGTYNANNSANVILYVGLGMIAIGLIITFVGLGDKGFQTLELKLIGPSLVGCGIFFALLRILFCTVPSCISSCTGKCCCLAPKKKELEKKNLIESRVPASSSLGDGFVPASRQESAKSRATPLPPIVSTQPCSSLTGSHFQPFDDDDCEVDAFELSSSLQGRRKPNRRKSSEVSTTFHVVRSAERRKTNSRTSSASKENRKSLDDEEFSLTDSDLIVQDTRLSKVTENNVNRHGSPKSPPLKNYTHELVLSADGL